MAPGIRAAHASPPAAKAHVQEVILFFGPPCSPTNIVHYHYTLLLIMTWNFYVNIKVLLSTSVEEQEEGGEKEILTLFGFSVLY